MQTLSRYRRSKTRGVIAVALAAVACAGCASPATSSRFESAAAAEASVATAVQRFREQAPQTNRYFDEAHGYAVFPGLGRFAAIVGGAYGRGVLVEQARAVGDVQVWHLIHGITFGGELYSEVVFFEDPRTLDEFKTGTLEFRGRAGLAAGPWGDAADPAFLDGVAIFTMTHGGLMLDVSVAGAKYLYRPLPAAAEEAADGER